MENKSVDSVRVRDPLSAFLKQYKITGCHGQVCDVQGCGGTIGPFMFDSNFMVVGGPLYELHGECQECAKSYQWCLTTHAWVAFLKDHVYAAAMGLARMVQCLPLGYHCIIVNKRSYGRWDVHKRAPQKSPWADHDWSQYDWGVDGDTDQETQEVIGG